MGKKKANKPIGKSAPKEQEAQLKLQSNSNAEESVVVSEPSALSSQIAELRIAITHLKVVEEETKKTNNSNISELKSVEKRVSKLKEVIQKYLKRIVEVEFECDEEELKVEDESNTKQSKSNKSMSGKTKTKTKTSSGVRKQIELIRKHQIGKRNLQAQLREKDQRLDELRELLAKTSEALTASSEQQQKSQIVGQRQNSGKSGDGQFQNAPEGIVSRTSFDIKKVRFK